MTDHAKELPRLAGVGEFLYGERWQRAIAQLLEIDDRLVRRWISGERPMPPWLWGRLLELLAAKREQLEKAILRALSPQARKLLKAIRESDGTLQVPPEPGGLAPAWLLELEQAGLVAAVPRGDSSQPFLVSLTEYGIEE